MKQEKLVMSADSLSEDQIDQILTKYHEDEKVPKIIEGLGFEKLKRHIPRLI